MHGVELNGDCWDFTMLFLTTISAIRTGHEPTYVMFSHYTNPATFRDAVQRALLVVLHQANHVSKCYSPGRARRQGAHVPADAHPRPPPRIGTNWSNSKITHRTHVHFMHAERRDVERCCHRPVQRDVPGHSRSRGAPDIARSG